METQEVGGSASPNGGQATEPQGSSVAHRQRLVDVDRAPCTADQEQEQEPQQEPQDEARAASRIRASDRHGGLATLSCIILVYLSGPPFAIFVGNFEGLVSAAMGTERVLAARVEVVLEVVRMAASEQYPNLMPTLYRSFLATVSRPTRHFGRHVVGF